jgi:hypothetical protein
MNMLQDQFLVFNNRQQVLNRCLLAMGIAAGGAALAWVSSLLSSPSLFEILALPVFMLVLGITTRLLLGWVLRAAPVEARTRPRSRRLLHLSLSGVVTVAGIVMLYQAGGSFEYRVLVAALIVGTGEVCLSVVFESIDYFAVCMGYARSKRQKV